MGDLTSTPGKPLPFAHEKRRRSASLRDKIFLVSKPMTSLHSSPARLDSQEESKFSRKVLSPQLSKQLDSPSFLTGSGGCVFPPDSFSSSETPASLTPIKQKRGSAVLSRPASLRPRIPSQFAFTAEEPVASISPIVHPKRAGSPTLQSPKGKMLPPTMYCEGPKFSRKNPREMFVSSVGKARKGSRVSKTGSAVISSLLTSPRKIPRDLRKNHQPSKIKYDSLLQLLQTEHDCSARALISFILAKSTPSSPNRSQRLNSSRLVYSPREESSATSSSPSFSPQQPRSTSDSPPPPIPISESLISKVIALHGDPQSLFLESLRSEVIEQDNLATVMRERSVSVSVLQHIMQAQLNLDEIVLPIIRLVGKLSRRQIRLLTAPKDERASPKSDHRREKLKTKLSKTFRGLLDTQKMPSFLSVLVHKTFSIVSEVIELKKEDPSRNSSYLSSFDTNFVENWTVGSLYFLRMLVPRLISLRLSSFQAYFSKGKDGMTVAKEGMVLIGRFLMKLCGKSKFSEESCLLNEVLLDLYPAYDRFCSQVIERGKFLYGFPVLTTTTSQQKEGDIVSEFDLHSLRQISLHLLETPSYFQPSRHSSARDQEILREKLQLFSNALGSSLPSSSSSVSLSNQWDE